MVCPDCGAEAGRKVVYCPTCRKAVDVRSGHFAPDPKGAYRCAECDARLIIWPADLPLPTEVNVRTLQASLQAAVSMNHGLMKVARAVLNMGELQGAEARFGRRLPASNARGWWN